jgi:4'-phosphopantetheinyl transferase
MRRVTREVGEFKGERLERISFAPAPSDLVLSTDEIHIWIADLDQSRHHLKSLVQTLSPEEHLRAKNYHFERDRTRYLLKHGILRTIAGNYLCVEPGTLHFQSGKYGKPSVDEIPGKRTIQFNLSHSNGVALFAFSRNHEVGVDIEHIRDMPEMEPIVERSFSLEEKKDFRSLPESQKREAFFNGWTRKEAFVKASGYGLFQSLNTFDVSLIPGEPAELLRIKGNSREACRWSIDSVELAPHYAGAFAVKSHSIAIKRWQWTRA